MPNTSLLHQTGGILIDLLFPIECLGCNKSGYFLCPDCLDNSIKPSDNLVCPICEQKSRVGLTHPKCQTPHSPEGIFIAGDLKDPLLNTAVKSFKYKNVQDLSESLAHFLTNKFNLHFSTYIRNKPWAVTYVPLHYAREKQRGYNQSSLIAKHFAQNFSFSCYQTLIRTKQTIDQTKLDRKERQKNVEGAFIKNRKFSDKRCQFSAN